MQDWGHWPMPGVWVEFWQSFGSVTKAPREGGVGRIPQDLKLLLVQGKHNVLTMMFFSLPVWFAKDPRR